MTVPEAPVRDLRTGLVDGIRAARETEREILDAIDPEDRDRPGVDGGWSAKDIQAHLSAWRRRQVDRMAASREGREEPGLAATETDEVNAIFHAERAAWPWDQVVGDADATTADLIAEIAAAPPALLEDPQVVGQILGNGPEHTLGHMAPLADRVGARTRVIELATRVETTVDDAAWPPRAAAFARYNLACFHALNGRLDRARELLRLALPDQEELRSFAPEDDDLLALRDELPSLAAG
jgi:DinB superfamily